jgi:hypothetical protein
MQEIPPPSEVARMQAEHDRLREEDEERNRRRQVEAETARRAAERYREEHADDPYAYPPIGGIPQSRFARVND